jgi:hypothetical protein
MNEDDLPAVEVWLHLPHVARWWTSDTTAEREIAKYWKRVTGTSARTIMLTVTWARDPIGWCQWYRWAGYPAEATAIDARNGESGLTTPLATRTGSAAGQAPYSSRRWWQRHVVTIPAPGY